MEATSDVASQVPLYLAVLITFIVCVCVPGLAVRVQVVRVSSHLSYGPQGSNMGHEVWGMCLSPLNCLITLHYFLREAH